MLSKALVNQTRYAFGTDLKKQNATKPGPVLLVAAFGPNNEDQQSFAKPSGGQHVVLLHHSDEMLQKTDTSMYGDRVL